MEFLSSSSADAVLRSGSFQYGHRRLFFARAGLFSDRIVFSGWHWTGRHQRTIPLADISKVEWWTGMQDEMNMALRLHNGERIGLKMKGAGLWKYKIEEHASNLKGKQPEPASNAMASAA